jgi:hypothetical protein
VLFPSIPFISLAAGENVKTLEQLGTATITPGQLGTPWLNVEGVGKKTGDDLSKKKVYCKNSRLFVVFELTPF